MYDKFKTMNKIIFALDRMLGYVSNAKCYIHLSECWNNFNERVSFKKKNTKQNNVL